MKVVQLGVELVRSVTSNTNLGTEVSELSLRAGMEKADPE